MITADKSDVLEDFERRIAALENKLIELQAAFCPKAMDKYLQEGEVAAVISEVCVAADIELSGEVALLGKKVRTPLSIIVAKWKLVILFMMIFPGTLCKGGERS